MAALRIDIPLIYSQTQPCWEWTSLEWTLVSTFYHKMAAALLNHIASSEDRKADKSQQQSSLTLHNLLLYQKETNHQDKAM